MDQPITGAGLILGFELIMTYSKFNLFLTYSKFDLFKFDLTYSILTYF